MYRIEEDEDSVIVLASSFREFMNFSNIFFEIFCHYCMWSCKYLTFNLVTGLHFSGKCLKKLGCVNV